MERALTNTFLRARKKREKKEKRRSMCTQESGTRTRSQALAK
jgi:hypothetical protein